MPLFKRRKSEKDGSSEQLSETSVEAILSSFRPFLGDLSTLPAAAADAAVMEMLPGLTLTSVVYEPPMVNFLAPESVAMSGGPEAVLEAGIKNLREMPLPNVESIRVKEGRDDTDVWMLGTEDVFGASRICMLDTLFSLVGATWPPPHGFLVAVPMWRLLMLHPVTGPGVMAALPYMAKGSLSCYEMEPERSRISRDVFYVAPDGRRQNVIEYFDDETGELRISYEGLLGEVLHGPQGLLNEFR